MRLSWATRREYSTTGDMHMISETIVRRIEANYRKSFGGIVSHAFDFNAIARDFVDESRAREELQRLATILGTVLPGKKLLEIGSGYGMFLSIARREFGVESWGVEPADQFEGTFATSIDLLCEMGISEAIVRQGFGENIPYEDKWFDIVYSSNVLEHVKDPVRVFQESLRVLRSGGYMVSVIPNYGSWWEGHYGMLMPPGCPKWLFKLIVSIAGRDASFIDTLNFITYRKLRRFLKPVEKEIEVLDYGQSIWFERLRTLSFSEWAELGKLKKLLRPIHSLKLTELIILLGRLFHWETPFVLVARKR
jgi:SAM-dependent methyltransferase